MVRDGRVLWFARALLASVLFACGSPLLAATDRQLKSIAADLKPAAAAAADFSFVVAGDNRPAAQGAPPPRALLTIFDEISLLRPALVLWSGDTVYGYCDTADQLTDEYEGFAAAARRGGVPVFNAPGNHEIHPSVDCGQPATGVCNPQCLQDAFTSRFGPLYGSFDYAGVHFISLDSEVSGEVDAIAGDQLAWLQKDLERNQGARGIFVFDHTEFYSSPTIDPDQGSSHPAISNRRALHDLFRRYPVKAVFSGHEHLYWREPAAQHDGIEYFVAGGAGAPAYTTPERGGFLQYLLVGVTGNTVTYQVIEPGRLYVEPAVAPTPTEARLWLVNGNYADQLTLGGIEAKVPVQVGVCADLTVATELKQRNGKPVPVPIEIVSCTPTGTFNKLQLKATGVPRGSSVPVVIRHR